LKKGLLKRVMDSLSPVGGVGGAWRIVDAGVLWVSMLGAAWPWVLAGCVSVALSSTNRDSIFASFRGPMLYQG
jgi:hypothetical protein